MNTKVAVFMVILLTVAGVAYAQSEQPGLVTDWLVLGAFPVETDHEPLAADHLGGEGTITPTTGDRVDTLIWHQVTADQSGQLDFVAQGIQPDELSVTYAHVYVYSPRLLDVRLLAGSDDGIRIWVNGNLVHHHEVLRGWRLDQDEIAERLGPGWNTLLCKVWNNRGGYALSLRVVGADGQQVDGLCFSATRPDDFKRAIVPAWYEFRNLSLADRAYISDKGKLRARVSADVVAHGTAHNQKPRCTLSVADHLLSKKELEQVSGLPARCEWDVSFQDIAQAAIQDVPLYASVRWGDEERSAQLPLRASSLVGMVLDGVECTQLLRPQGDRGNDLAGSIIVPKELRPYVLALQILGAKDGAEVEVDGHSLTRLSDKRGLWAKEVSAPRQVFEIPRGLLPDNGELCIHVNADQWTENLAVLLDVIDVDFRTLQEDLAFGEIYFDDQDLGAGSIFKSMLQAFIEQDAASVINGAEEVVEVTKPFADSLKQQTIHVVGNAHIDMAWLWRWKETVEVCEQTFRQAIEFMKVDPDFTYAQSQAQAYEWMETYHPDVLAGIQEMVKRGQWLIVGGMWVEPDSNLPSGESFVRQILFGMNYFREKFGVEPRVAWTPDTFGYAWTLPQIYKKSGLDYFVTAKIWWNDTTPPEHHLFWWESPDGSRIMTVIPRSYGGDLDEVQTLRDFKGYKENTGKDDYLVLYGVGDHGGGPTKEMLARFDHMATTRLYPTVRKSTPEEFFETVSKESDDLPVICDEMYLQYHRGTYTTQAKVKRNNRQMEVLLESAEKFASFAETPYPRKQLHQAWKGTLFNQFHDILPGSSIPEVYVDAHALYDSCRALAEGALTGALEDIASRVDARGKGQPVVVFNPLSWERNDVVEIRLPRRMQESGWRVVDAKGKELPSQVFRDGLLCEVSAVPALGYKLFWLQDHPQHDWTGAPRVTKWRMENDSFRVEINEESGNLASIFDKQAGCEVLAGPGNELQFFEDIPAQWDAWNIGYTGKEWRADHNPALEIIEAGPVRATIRVIRKTGDSQFVQDVSLYRKLSRIDVRNMVKWHESHVLAKAAFPVAVESDMATYEIPYGSIRRTTNPKTPSEKAMFEVPAHKWIDLSEPDGSYGVSLLNDSKYGFDVRGSQMRITLLRSPKSPDPNADMGEHEFLYSLYPHRGDWKAAETHRRAYELNYPLLAVMTEPHSGALSPEGSFVGVKASPGVMVSAIKQAEAGSGLVVRLYEQFGQVSRVDLKFPRSVIEANETDLLERAIGDVKFDGSKVRTVLAPFEIKTLFVRLEDL